MRDPKPIAILMAVGMLGWLYLALQALTWSPEQRYSQLVSLMAQEQAQSVPPQTLLAQAKWLFVHRQAQLLAVATILAPAFLIGASEGVLRRATDQRGGFLLTWWTIGILGGSLTLVAAWGFLTLPYVCPPLYAAWVLGMLGGLSVYGLTAGRPAVA